MFVARVVCPARGGSRGRWSGTTGWSSFRPSGFLSFLTDSGRSPNTVKAYAHDLRDWFAFLTGAETGLGGRVTVEDVAAFVAWLRLPPPARGSAVAVLPVGAYCSASTINRQARSGWVDDQARGQDRVAVHAALSVLATRGP